MSSVARHCLAVCCLLLLARVGATASEGPRVLVLLEEKALKSSHSLFFDALTSRGYQLSYSAATAPTLKIKDWDTYLYEKVIVFASGVTGMLLNCFLCMTELNGSLQRVGSVEFGGTVDATALLEFVDDGHDLLLATDSDASDELRELAADLGVDFDAKGSVVTDHFNRYDQGADAILTSNTLGSEAVFGSQSLQVISLC